jgi:hypothetical protein
MTTFCSPSYGTDNLTSCSSTWHRSDARDTTRAMDCVRR